MLLLVLFLMSGVVVVFMLLCYGVVVVLFLFSVLCVLEVFIELFCSWVFMGSIGCCFVGFLWWSVVVFVGFFFVWLVVFSKFVGSVIVLGGGVVIV